MLLDEARSTYATTRTFVPRARVEDVAQQKYERRKHLNTIGVHPMALFALFRYFHVGRRTHGSGAKWLYTRSNYCSVPRIRLLSRRFSLSLGTVLFSQMVSHRINSENMRSANNCLMEFASGLELGFGEILNELPIHPSLDKNIAVRL
jgi:hypothetical protein